MKLTQLKVNHLKNPLGFSVKNPSFSFQVAESSGSTLKAVRIRIAEKEDMSELLYDSGMREDISSLSFCPGNRIGRRKALLLGCYGASG